MSGIFQDHAVWLSIGANRKNGLRLSSDDKKKAIEIALTTFSDKSQTIIAEHVGCDQGYVSKIKNQLMTSHKLKAPEKTIGKDGKARPATMPKPVPVQRSLPPLVPDQLNNIVHDFE